MPTIILLIGYSVVEPCIVPIVRLPAMHFIDERLLSWIIGIGCIFNLAYSKTIHSLNKQFAYVAFMLLSLGIIWSAINYPPAQWWTARDPAENLLGVLVVALFLLLHDLWHQPRVRILRTLHCWIAHSNLLSLQYLRPTSIIHTAATWHNPVLATPLWGFAACPRLHHVPPRPITTRITHITRDTTLWNFWLFILTVWLILLMMKTNFVTATPWVITLMLLIMRPARAPHYSLSILHGSIPVALGPELLCTSILLRAANPMRAHLLAMLIVWSGLTTIHYYLLPTNVSASWFPSLALLLLLWLRRFLRVRRLRATPFLPTQLANRLLPKRPHYG